MSNGIDGRSRDDGGQTVIVIVQATVPAYREPVFAELAGRFPDLRVLHGDQYFDPSIKSTNPSGAFPSAFIRNRYLFGRRALWQSGVWRHARQASAVILEMNPRNLTAWALLLSRRRTSVILWGHAWSRSGRDAFSNVLRRAMRRLSAAVVVYTATEAEEMAARGEQGAVFVASNGLYPAAWLEGVAIPAISASEPKPGTFVVSSRLVRPKRVDLAIRALGVARRDYGVDACLLVVGDGPARAGLVELARREEVAGAVTFLGAIFDARELLDIYLASSVAVVPGYAGLSVIQALNFGRPVIVARGEPHAPEIESASRPGACRWIDSGDARSLAAAMVAYMNDPPSRVLATSLATWSAATYSTDCVADGLQSALQEVAQGFDGFERP